MAQVHTGTLKSGEEIVVKVIRPEIEKIIDQDIALLQTIAHFVENNIDQGKRLRALEVVKDYDYIIHDELNLVSEGANATQLARNFEDSDLLYVPKVYWEFCRPNVLVMERIYGIPVSQVEELKAAGINLKTLAERGVQIFLHRFSITAFSTPTCTRGTCMFLETHLKRHNILRSIAPS